MRVNSTNNNASTEISRAGQTAKATGADSKRKAGNEAAPIAGESTKTEISERAKELAKAKKVAGGAPDVREQKIAELKRRIAEGKYNVDANAVADRLVDDHLKSGIG